MDDQIVFTTPWFDLIAKHAPGYAQPHYSIRTSDYVMVVPVTAAGELVLVRQFRPAVSATTLELPSGHVDSGETAAQAARRELLEETGFHGAKFEPLGELSPDTGRLGNRLCCFYLADAQPPSGNDQWGEAGVEPVMFGGSLLDLLAEPTFNSALNHAALLLAVARGRLSIR